MTPGDALQKRGIAAVAQAAGWRSQPNRGQAGWAFPVYDYQSGKIIGMRWKAAPGQQGPKYLWRPQKPQNPAVDWYILPGTAEAVAAAGGVCYLANGEPSLLSYVAAGLRNVITTTLSEIAVPGNVEAVCKALGISRLLYPVDNDEAGYKSAVNWRQALAGAGLDYVAQRWPADMVAKGDANDLWIETGFDRALFTARLAEMQPLELPAPEPARPIFERRESTAPRAGGDLVDWDEWRRRWWLEAVLPAVDSAVGQRRGKHFRCINPNHEDRNPSARISTDKDPDGLYICTCADNGAHGRETVAGWVNAPEFMSWWREQNPTIAGTSIYSKSLDGPTEAELTPGNVIEDPWADLPSVTPPDLTYKPPPILQPDDSARWPGWDEGLLEAEEQAIAVLGKKNEDVLLYVYVAGGLWQGATAQELAEKSVELGAPISYGRVLSAWMADGGEMFRILETEKEDIYPVYKTEKKSRGRAAERRQLIDRQALHNIFKRRAAYKLADTAATTTDGAVLPMYIKAELLENLGIDGDLEQIAARLADITDRLKVQKPEFKTDIDRWYARFKRLWGDIIDALISSDFAETVIDDDLRNHAHATGSMILQAQRERDYVTSNPDQPRSRWATMTYTGVSNGSVNKLRDLAKLRHIGGQPPVQRAEIRTIDPVDAMKQAQEVQKQAGGRITHVAGADGRFYPYNRNNVQNCLSYSLQAGDDVLYFEMSVAGPLERYEPEPQPERQSELIERPTIERIEADQDTEERRRTRRQRYDGPGHDPHIAIEQIYILMRETGWFRDESLSAWRDPAGVYWPDHAATLVNRLTGVPVKNARGPLTEADLQTRELNAALEADESAEVPIERPYFDIVFGRKTG